MNKIKNIIFDWGNVLIDVRPENFIEECKKVGVKFTNREVNSTHKAGFFLEHEMGVISDKQFRNEFRLCSSSNLTDEEIDFIWNSYFGKVPLYKLELLVSLKRKYNLYLLSNTNSIHWNRYSGTVFSYNGLNVNDIFDGVYLSYMLHSSKPDERIFKMVIEDSGIDVNETLFVDDSLKNCYTAQRLGMEVLNYIPGSDLRYYLLKELE